MSGGGIDAGAAGDKAHKKRAGPLALIGWVLFDWASQPFYTLITTFLFAPYFVSVFVGDPVEGQSLWALSVAVAGIAVALMSPLLGAVADASGRRKPWIFVFSVVFVASQAVLWFAVPEQPDRLFLIVGAIILATVTAEFATVFTNAMMPALIDPRGQGRLSGIGWAVGYAGGLASLLVLVGFVIADRGSRLTQFGLQPIITIGVDAREGARLAGPFSALWYALFVVPLFLFTPDAGSAKRVPLGQAVRLGFAALISTIRNVRRYRDVALFLLARLLYIDGLTAIFAFGGIYATAVFGWDSMALGFFGIILSVTAALGAVAGGFFDDRFGAKPVILGALMALLVGAFGVISVDRGQALFVIPLAEPSAQGALFGSIGERIYLAFAVVIGLAAGPLQAASRSFMSRAAPPHLATEFFGLYAFSGKITAFAAPLAIAAITSATGSIRLGIASIAVFLIAGFAVMLKVEPVLRDGSGRVPTD